MHLKFQWSIHKGKCIRYELDSVSIKRSLSQSVFAAVAFFYSGYVLLTWQLLVMVIMGFTGTLCFFMVERMQNMSFDTHEY